MAGELKFTISADNKAALQSLKQLQSQVNTTANNITKSGQSVDGFFTKLGNTFDNWSQNIVKGFSSIIAGAAGFQAAMEAGNFIKQLQDNVGQFNKAMKEVSTISQDVTNDIAGYKEQILELTQRVPIGATEAAKALYQVVSAGQQGADAMHVLEVSAKLAVGGVTETATAADALTTILNAYHMSAADAQAVSDKLFTTVKLGKTTMAELGSTIATAAPTAAAYGVSINDLLAAVAAMTKQGTPTAVAMTQINAAITQGVNVLGDGAFVGRSFAEALGEIEKKAGGSMTALKGDISNVRALKAVLQLTGEGATEAARCLDEITNSAGAAEEAFGKMFDTEAAQRFLNNLQAAYQPIGEEIKGWGKEVMNAISEGMEDGKFTQLAQALEGLVAAYGVYKAAVITTMAVESAQKGLLAGLTLAEKAYMVQLILTEKAQALLNATMLSNPYVAAAAAIGVLVGAIIYCKQQELEMADAQRIVNEESEKLIENQEQLASSAEGLLSAYQSAANGTAAQTEALIELRDKYPGLFEKYEKEIEYLDIITAKKAVAYEWATQKTYAELDKKYQEFNRKSQEFKDDANSHDALDPEYGGYITTAGKKSNNYDKLAQQQKRYNARYLTERRVNLLALKAGGMSVEQRRALSAEIARAQGVAGGRNTSVKLKFGDVDDYVTQKDLELLSRVVNAGNISTKEQQQTNGSQADADAKAKATKSAAEKARQERVKKAKEEQALADTKEQQQRQEARTAMEQAFNTRQYEIDLKAESLAKEKEQALLDYDKEIAAITQERQDIMESREQMARALWEAEHKADMENGQTWLNSGAQKSWRSGFAYTADDLEYFGMRDQAAVAAYETKLNGIESQQRQNMYDYLKEYGTYEEKRRAIVEESNAKIAAENDEWVKKSIQAQAEAALSTLDLEQIQKTLDWEFIFNDLDGYTDNYLAELQKKLQELLKDTALKPEDAKILADQLNKVVEVTSKRKGGGLFGQLFQGIGKRKDLERQISYYGTLASQADARGDANDAEKQRQRQAAAKDQLEQYNQGNTLQKVFGDAFNMANPVGFIGTINNNVQSLKALTETLGVDDSEFGEKVAQFADGFAGINNAAQSLMSGDVFGAINGVFQAVIGFGEFLGIGGSSDETLLADIERLALSNENLQRSIDALAAQMKDTAVGDAAQIYQSQKANLETAMANTQSVMARAGAAYNSGILGIKGQKSSNKKINDAMTTEGWQRISKIVGQSVNGAAQFWQLSSEQMYKVMRDASDLWTIIQDKANDGYMDASQFMDEYIEYWQQLQDLENAYFEKLTGSSFDSILDSFGSMIKTMTTTTQDWGNTFEDTLRDAIVNALQSDYKDEIQDWYEQLAGTMENGSISAAERDALWSEYQGIVKQMENARDAQFAALGITDASGSASATTNAAMSISEDTANELVGRMTAIQIGVENARTAYEAVVNGIAQAVANYAALAQTATASSEHLAEIRNLMITNASYLEDIARYAKSGYAVMAEKLTRIAANTDKL